MAGALDNRRTERTYRKCFRCEYEYHLIAKYPKPPKDNEKLRKQVCFNEKGNRACNNSKNKSDQKKYEFLRLVLRTIDARNGHHKKM